ncbi:hypothetical protein [Enterococcus rotai]|uniref:hypothetical protein n=1 Tax=Enterococcus rotai TaxID=118060 RepID=UPI0032B5832C
MKEIQNFDYSVLDGKTANFLKLKEQELQSIVLNSSVQLGEKLIETQEKLANFNTGTFEKWFTSIGLKKRTVYNYINQAKFVHQMHEHEQIEMFQELPTTLKTEISKPSAEPEAVELVLSGDIKTTKEYRDLEKQLKQKDQQIDNLSGVIAELNEKEPQVIERTVTVEKVPDDYKQLKKSVGLVDHITHENEMLKSEQERLEKQIEETNAALQLKQKIGNDDIEEMQLKRLQREADINVHQLIISINNFVKEQAITVYDSAAIAGATDETKKKLSSALERNEKLIKEIKQEIGGNVSWVIN